MYTRVESKFWQDEKMRTISCDARYLMLYLLTSPHRNILGLYFLPVPYACFDLGWDEERFNKGFKELLSKGCIKYDFDSNIVFIVNFLKHNPLENQNQVKSAIDKLKQLPNTFLIKDLYEVVKDGKPHYNKLAVQLSELLKKGLDKQLGKGLGKGLGKQEEVKEEEEVKEKELLQEQEEESSSSFLKIRLAEDFKEIVSVYQQVIGQPNGLTPQWIEEILKEYGAVWVKSAMLEAEKRGKRTKKYVEGILQNWKRGGGIKIRSDTDGTNRHDFGTKDSEFEEYDLSKGIISSG